MSLSAGEKLREARLKAGLTLDSAAARTRVRRDYLEALEDMEPRGLPARAYAIGYLRTYANFLGLEAEGLIDQFKREVDTETGRSQPTQSAEIREIKLPRGLFGAGLILASLAGVAIWYASHTPDTAGLRAVPLPPDARMDDRPAWAAESSDLAYRASTPAETWAGVPSAEPVDAVSDLVFRVTRATSIEIKNAEGQIVVSRQVAPGENIRAEIGGAVSTQDAGALSLVVNGVDTGLLGLDGESVSELVIETIALPRLASNE